MAKKGQTIPLILDLQGQRKLLIRLFYVDPTNLRLRGQSTLSGQFLPISIEIQFQLSKRCRDFILYSFENLKAELCLRLCTSKLCGHALGGHSTLYWEILQIIRLLYNFQISASKRTTDLILGSLEWEKLKLCNRLYHINLSFLQLRGQSTYFVKILPIFIQIQF